MKIESHELKPTPPPKIFSMTFNSSEGWAIVEALRVYADKYPKSENAKEWEEWAYLLSEQLRVKSL